VKVLVTGANGLIGSRLAATLSAQGHEVLGLGRGPQRAALLHRYLECDLLDSSRLRQAVLDAGAEVIVNTAALRDVDACEKNPESARAQNAGAVAVLAEAANAVGALLVQVSTDYVFDGAHGPYDEDATPAPLSVYGRTKLEGEAEARKARLWAVARTAVVYGKPLGAQPNFGTWLSHQFLSAPKVRLFEDQWVTPSHALNVAQMLGELCHRKLEGVWHLAGGEAVTRVQFGETFCEVFGVDRLKIEPTRLSAAGLTATRPLRAGLRTAKATHLLENKPWSVREALQRFRAELTERP